MIKIYKITLLFIFNFLGFCSFAQVIDTANFSIKGSRIYINSGTTIYIDGTINNIKSLHPFAATADGQILNNDTIYLAGNIANKINNHPLFLFGGTVNLRYNFVQYFRNDTINFHNLVLNKTNNRLILQRNISVGNQFNLVKGTADLVSYNLDLLNNGSLIGENFQNYIFSNQGWLIARNRLLNPSNNGDVSTLKLQLNPASDNLGLTTIYRKNKTQDSLVDGSIERMYELYPNNTGSTDIQFNYSDLEWQNLPTNPNELNFRLFHSTVVGVDQSPSKSWRMDSLSVVDAAANRVNSANLLIENTGKRITLADKDCKVVIPISLPNSPVWLCVSDSVTLDAGTVPVRYLWSNGATSQTLKIKGASIVGTSMIVSVIGFNAKGCLSTKQVQINVYPNPTPIFTSGASACKDVSMVFNNTSSVSGGGSLTYLWKFHDGSTSTFQNPTFTFTTQGTFANTLIVTSPYGCKDSLSKNIVILPKPVANFSPNVTEECEQKIVTFNNNSTISTGGIASSIWTFGDGFTSNLSGGSSLNSELKSYSNAGNYSIKLRVRSSGNCLDSTYRSLTIHSKPVANFTASGFVSNLPTSFSNVSSIASGYSLIYDWDLGDGLGISTDKDPIYTYSISGIYNPELIVTSNKGCKDTITNAVVISGMPQVAFNFTSAGNCMYDAIQFQNASTIDAGSLNYVWDFGDGTTSTLTNPNKKYTSPGVYTISLQATASSGLTNSATQVITVDPIPSASFIVSGVCQGLANSFANTSSIATGTNNYFWDFGDGNTSTNTSINYTYTAAGTYLTKLYATSDKGCKDTANVTAEVFPNPKANFTVSNACQGQVTGFVNASTIAGGTMNYYWSFGNATTSTQANPTLTYANANTYNVILNINSDNGCTDQIQRSVQIYPVPVANFSASTSCFKNPTNFTNQSTLSSGTMTYSWNFGAASSTGINPNYTFPNSNTFSVFLTATSNNSCSHTISKNVSVRPLPNTDFTANITCEGQVTQFTNASTIADIPANSALTYSWRLGSGITSSLINPTRNFESAGNYSITLTASSVFGCQKDTVKNVSVVANPVINISAQDNCIGQNTVFTNSSSVAGASLTYLWNFNDGTTSIATIPTKIFNQAKTHQVDLTATSAQGCVSTGSVSVVVSPKANLSFTFPSTICANTPFTVNNSSTITAGTYSQLWNFGSQATSSLTNPTHTFANGGTYDISLQTTSDKGCVSSSTSSIEVYSSPDVDFNIAPNGSSGLIFSNLTSISGGGLLNYIWNFGDGNTSLAANPQHNYSFTGTYNVQLTANSANGCSNTISKSAKFPYNNIADFEVSGGRCVGSVFNFIDKSIFSDPSLSYQWNFGDGNVSTLKNPVNTFLNSGSYSVTLIVTPSVGASVSKTINVVVAANPQINFTANNACEGSVVNFNNTSIDKTNVSFTWNLGDGSTATSENTNKTYLLAGTYPVELLAVSAQGCQSKISKNISIRTLPGLDFGDTLKTCGNSLPLNAQNLGSSYLWNTNENTSSILVNADGNYSVEITNSFGCKFTAQTYVKLNVPYQINLGQDRALCEKERLDIGYSAHSIAWSNGSSDRYLIVTISGMYSVSGTDINGCVSTDIVNITINSAPNVDLGLDRTVCEIAILDAQNIGSTFDWLSAQNSQQITISQSGLYQVEVTNANGCKASDVVNITVISAPEVDLGADVSVCGIDFPYLLAVPTGTNTFLWSNGGTNNAIQVTAPGMYALTATSSFGCKSTDNILIATKVEPTVNLGSDRGFCTNDSLLLDAANAGSTFAWSNGKNTSTIFVKNAGQYSVRVTAANGCVATDEITVNENNNPYIGFEDTLKKCDNQLPLTIQSPNGFANYAWSNGMSTSAVQVSVSGLYTLTVTDVNMCKTTDEVYVEIQNSPLVNLGNGFSFCQGDSVMLNANNEGASYLWSTNETTQSIYTKSGGAINVLVTNANGCSNSSSINLTMNIKPIVNLGSDRTVCAGQNATLNAGNSGSDFAWSTGETSQTLVAVNNGRYVVTVTASNGCSNTDDVVVNVVASPSQNLGNDIATCKAPILDAGNIGSQYLWSNNALTRQITASTSATYIVQITNANNCIARDTIDITIYPKPILELGNDTAICAGQEILLDAQNFGSTYFWSNSAVTKTITVNQTGLYKATVINANQCSTSDSVRVLVKPNPSFSFGADRNFCTGGSVTLSTSLPVGTTYLWSDGSTSNTLNVNSTSTIWLRATGTNGCFARDTVGVFSRPFPVINLGNNLTVCGRANLDAQNVGSTYIWSNGQTSQSIVANQSNNYNVKVTSEYGCSASDTINVVVKTSPLVNLGADINACNGDVIAIFANTNAEQFTWNTSDTLSVISVTGSGSYSLTAQNGNGCISKDTINVQFNSKPIINFSPQYPVCGNAPLKLDAQNTGSSYYWSSNNGFVSTQRQVNITEGGLYTVTVTNAFGCAVSATIDAQKSEFAVYAEFLAVSSVNAGDSVKLINLSYPGEFDSVWDFGDGIVSNEVDPSHTYFVSGDIPVKLTVSNGICTDSKTKNINIKARRELPTVQKQEGSIFYTKKLYPNPTDGRFIVEVELYEMEELALQFYSINGRLIDTRISEASKFHHSVYEFPDLAEGFYIVRITAKNQQDQLRVIIKK